MKKQYIYSALVLTALLTAGCAKEIENTLDGSDSSAIELSSVSTDPMTKAVITGTEFTTTEAAAGIGLFLLDANGKAYGENAGNVKYTFSSSKWTAQSPLRAGGTSGMLYGYYPYSEGITDIAAIPVESSINGTDYLYASPVEVNSSNAKNVSLLLSHALARVSLSFKLDKSYEGSGALSVISLSGDCVAASGTLNAKTGGINATAGAFSADGLDRTIDKDTPTTVECLVVPVSIESGTPKLRIACTIDGKAYATTFTGNLAAITQGKQTTIELTVQNTSLTVDGSSIGAWGDGGSQTVTVGGNYTVTIAYSSDDGIKDDVWIKKAEVVGNSVIVTARSNSGEHLKCTMSDSGDFCTSQSKKYGPVLYNKKGLAIGYQFFIYSFTISNITKNTTATIGYANPVSIGVTPSGAGSVGITGDAYEGETVTLKANPAYEYGFDAWLDKDGDALSCEEETYSNPVRLSSNGMSVRFKENLILDGVFTVADDGMGTVKKVRFTRGNLYRDSGVCKIEQHQYDFNSFYTEGFTTHVSHFMWCNNEKNAASQTYDTSWDGQTSFFTETERFSVYGFNPKQCHTLTTEEWRYLFSKGDYDNDARRGKYKTGVTVCGKRNCLVLLPDNWTGGTIENSYDYVGWKHMEAAGAVCLLAAGRRNGKPGYDDPFGLGGEGKAGYYWSVSHESDSKAFNLFFNDNIVNPESRDDRYTAQTVRLVTEVTE